MHALWGIERRKQAGMYQYFLSPLTFEEATHSTSLLKSRFKKKGPKKEAWKVVYLYSLKLAFLNV